MSDTFTYNYNNPIENAYNAGKPFVVLQHSNSNHVRLHRFKNKHNINCTGKNLHGNYVVVFWDKLINESEVA